MTEKAMNTYERWKIDTIIAFNATIEIEIPNHDTFDVLTKLLLASNSTSWRTF